jgi:methylenetetrahydrofolate dehydrogenase (NADP+)/methenyltetrahydrofolate cyclohydrolase
VRAVAERAPLTGARTLAGAPIAAEIRSSVKADVESFRRHYGYVPTLAVVIVGRDAPSTVYLEQILKGCRTVGIRGRMVEISGRVSADGLRRQIADLNADAAVAGIIVQMPLPRRLPLAAVLDTIDPAKDVDGIHPRNAGLLALGYDGFLPTTAQAAVEVLHRSGVPLAGRHAVVVGRSNVVGRPVASLLLRDDATVTICHSRTRDLSRHTRAADVLVVAAGRPGVIDGTMVKPGAVVVDVGINVVDGRLTGDVDFESVRAVASAITPVPGGIGPVTNALLLAHVMTAARAQARTRRGRRAGLTVANGPGRR